MGDAHESLLELNILSMYTRYRYLAARPGLKWNLRRGRLARERPETCSLILTTFGRPGYMRRALAERASGFLLKDAPANELAEAIRTVVAGGCAVDTTWRLPQSGRARAR
jgi:DNA-binding NarL/FixJ family response regulator